MKLYYDIRLGYLVQSPGSASVLTNLEGKAGDGQEIVLQFGRSSDPVETGTIIQSGSWTAENLVGGTVITCAIKESGAFSDGVSLAANSSWTNDAALKTYTGYLNLNTVPIDTALARLSGGPENDIASAACGFELTFQPGGSGSWRSSVLPVIYTLYHDIISGVEGTPAAGDDAAQYLLKTAGIEWLPGTTSKIGGTVSDLDSIASSNRELNTIVAFYDADVANDWVRMYRLESGTDAENSPMVIRPDDYATTTNQRVWKLRPFAGDALVNPNTAIGLASSVNGVAVVFDGETGKALKQATGSGMAKLTSGVLGTATAATDFVAPGPATTSGLTMATARILGRNGVGTGAPQELTLGGGLSISSLVVISQSIPFGIEPQTPSFTLTPASHNNRFVVCSTSGITVTIPPQSSTGWPDNSNFWIFPQFASGSLTIARGSGVSLIVPGGTSANYVLAGGSLPIRIWRAQENGWYIIS